MNREQNSGLVRNTLFTSAGSGVALVAVFAEAIIATRVLTEDRFGAFVLTTAAVMLMTTLADLGLAAAITQRVAASPPEKRSALIATGIACRAAMFVVIGTLAFALPGAIKLASGSVELKYQIPLALAMFGATSLEEFTMAALRGCEYHQRASRIQVFRATVRLVLSAALILVLGLGVEALILSWSVAYTLSAATAIAILRPNFRLVGREHLGELMQYGKRAFFPRTITYIVTFLPVTLLGAVGTTAAVALFGVAQRLPAGLRTISDALTTVFFPRMTRLLADNDVDGARQLLLNSMLIAVTGIGAVAIGTAFIGDDVLALFFGEPYRKAGTTLVLLVLALTITLPNWLMGFSLSASGRAGVPAFITLGEALVLLPVSVIFIDRFQQNALAAAMGVAAFGGLPIAALLLGRAGLAPRWGWFIAQMALLSVFVVGCILLEPRSGGIFSGAAAGLVASGLYLALSAAVAKRHRPEVMSSVRSVVSRTLSTRISSRT